MAKGRRVSGISVPIQLDTSAVQRDMEALGSDLSTTINKVSKSLDGALNPKAILKGVVDLNKALGQMRDSAKIWDQMGDSQSKFSKQIIGLRPQLKSLAQEFGGTIKQQRELMTMLVKNQAVAQEVDSLRLWEKQLGKTKEEVVQLFRERGKMVSAAAIKEFIPNSTVENAKKLKEEYKELAKLAGAVESKEGLKKYVDTANIKQAVSAFQQLNGTQKITAANFEQIAKGAKVSTDAVKHYVNEMQRAANSARGWTGIFTPTSVAAGTQSAMAAMGVVGGMYGVVELGKAMFDASLKMDSLSVAFKSIYNNAKTADAQLQFVSSTSDALGLSFISSAEGAKKLFAAAQGTEIQDNVNEIFTSFSMMGSALKLTGDEMNSVFLAISQMISKGKVSAEELRLQLAERMPGAVQLFAKSMGIGTRELDKLLQEGKVGLSDLVKFSETVGSTYIFGAMEASRSLQAEMSRVQNEWFKLKKAFIDSKAAAGTMRWLAETLKSVVGYAPAIKETAIVLGQLGAAFAAFKILSSVVPLFTSFIGAISLSPVSALVAGLGVLATAISAVDRHLHKSIPLVEEYGVAFSDLQSFAESAASAVGNTATVVYERQKAEYEKLKKDLKEGLSGGFASMFNSLKAELNDSNVMSVDIKSFFKINEIAESGRKAAEEFSKEFDDALQRGDEEGQQKAVVKYEKTARAILETVDKYADLLPKGFKESIDKMLGSISNLYMTMEDRGSRLRDGEFASAIKELGLNLPKFTAEFEKLKKAAADTPFGKLEKKDLVSEDALKSITDMAIALGEAHQRYAEFNEAARENGVTGEVLVEMQGELNKYYDQFKTALDNAGAAALANGTSLDAFKEGIINMLNQAGLAAPVLAHLTEIVNSMGDAVRNAAEAANIKWADDLLTRFKTMGLKQGSEEYEALKKKRDLDEINKKLAEGAISQEKANELIDEMNAGYKRLASTVNDRVGGAFDSAQNKIENYADSLKALSAEVQNLELAYNDQNSTVKEAMLLAEKNTAIAKAQAKADQDIRRKSATVAQATAYVALSTKKAELDYALKLRETEEKTSEARLSFYKDLSAFSGEYEQTAVYQNKLLETQARLWRNLGIPMADINKMIEYQRKEMSKDFTDGATRGLEKYIAKAKDFAAQAESMVTSFVQGFEDATTKMFTDFIENGKFTLSSFKSIFTSMLNDLVRISLVRPITVQLASAFLGGDGSGASNGQSGGGSSGASSGNGLVDAGMDMAQQYGISQLMDGAGSSGMFSGLVNGLNSGAAYLFPSTFAPTSAIAAGNASVAGVHSALGLSAPSGLGPTQTLSGAWSAAAPTIMGAGIGSMVGGMVSPYLNNALGLGTGQNASTGAMVGGLGATAVLGTLALANMWHPGGWLAGGIAGLSALLGGGIGGAFGEWNDAPGLTAGAVVDLAKTHAGPQMEDIHKLRKHPWSWYTHADDTGYLIQTRHRDGMPKSAAEQATAYLEQVARQGLALSDQVATALGGVTGGLADAYKNSLGLDSYVAIGRDWEGETPDIEGLGNEIFAAMKGKISGALRRMDISSLSIAADGMVADTTEEMMMSISKSMQFFNVGESLGDYSGEFTQAVSGKVLDMLNSMDTSGMRLDIDKSSLAGWSAAAIAIQTMDGVNTSIRNTINPASELTTVMTTANAQMDTWIATLKQLGWQEAAIAEVEAKRLAYLEQYESALTRSAEQNLYLRSMALSSGTNSLEYQMQALKYQQENERNEYAKKYGSEDELLAAKAVMLNREGYKGKNDWDIGSVYEAIKAEGMTVVEWLERHGRSEGFQQDISLSNQLMYTQQAELIQTELNYWQKQYDSMMKAQIAAEQEKARSDYETLRDKISDEQNKLQEQYRAEQELMRGQISSTRDAIRSLEDLVDSFENASEKLEDARHALWGGANNLSTSRMSDVRANWSEVYAKAMAGDTEAMSELPSISTNLLNLGKEQLESRDVYQDLFYDVDRKLKDAQDIAKSQYSVNKSQYDAQKSLLASQEAALAAQKVQYDAQNANLNAQLSAQQAAYNTQIAQLNAQSAQLGAQKTSNNTLSGISSKISSLTAQLANSVAQTGSTSTTQNEALLQAKAKQLNMIGYLGRTNWDSQSVQNAINKSGMSLDQWWTRHGFGEGISSTYKSTTSTKYDSDAALLWAKARAMNKHAEDGRTNWTAADIAKEITDAGMTIFEWYVRHGQFEGFATGGITPANRPFWVGENGPELVVSPRQWGVINHSDSMALTRGASGGRTIDSGSIVAAINNVNDTLRQLLTKTDRIMADQGRIRDRMDMFAQEGVTIAAA